MFFRALPRLAARPRLAAAAAVVAGGGVSLRAHCASAPSHTPSDVANEPSRAAGSLAQPSMLLSWLTNRSMVRARAASKEPAMVIVSPTFYPSLEDTRCQLALAACRTAKDAGVPLLLVDASPAAVRSALIEAGAMVRPQTRKGRKGAALREAIDAAVQILPADGVICYQELEKVVCVFVGWAPL